MKEGRMKAKREEERVVEGEDVEIIQYNEGKDEGGKNEGVRRGIKSSRRRR